jgi:SSS family solute:Na+ symporter
LLIGTVTGFAMVWYVATATDISWPWYCLIGAVTNFVVSSVASIVLEGRKTTWSPYTIKGQKEKFRAEGLQEKDGGWYLVPGRVDRFSYLLLVFFVAVIAFLALFDHLV